MKPDTISPQLARATAALLLAATLAACGGGGVDASVSNITASPTRYSQTMFVTVNGRGLGAGIEMTVDGPCNNVTRVAGTSEDTVQWTCVINGLGEVVPRVRHTDSRRELGSVKVDIPPPRVSMAFSDGTRNGAMIFELDAVLAPVAVNNFLAYVAAGFYRNTVIHRAVPNEGIQGGTYTTAAATGTTLITKAATLAPITPDAVAGMLNLRGTLAVVRDDAVPTVTAKFFINSGDNPKYDLRTFDSAQGKVTVGNLVIGKLVEGLNVLDVVSSVPTVVDVAELLTNVPKPPVTITLMSQTR